MPYRNTPPPQTWPAHAGLKRKAAARHEAIAVRQRAEAAELDRMYAEHRAAEVARQQAAENVAQAVVS